MNKSSPASFMPGTSSPPGQTLATSLKKCQFCLWESNKTIIMDWAAVYNTVLSCISVAKHSPLMQIRTRFGSSRRGRSTWCCCMESGAIHCAWRELLSARVGHIHGWCLHSLTVQSVPLLVDLIAEGSLSPIWPPLVHCLFSSYHTYHCEEIWWLW